MPQLFPSCKIDLKTYGSIGIICAPECRIQTVMPEEEKRRFHRFYNEVRKRWSICALEETNPVNTSNFDATKTQLAQLIQRARRFHGNQGLGNERPVLAIQKLTKDDDMPAKKMRKSII